MDKSHVLNCDPRFTNLQVIAQCRHANLSADRIDVFTEFTNFVSLKYFIEHEAKRKWWTEEFILKQMLQRVANHIMIFTQDSTQAIAMAGANGVETFYGRGGGQYPQRRLGL